jgi:tetratricopeptide (TPR) repeat protein
MRTANSQLPTPKEHRSTLDRHSLGVGNWKLGVDLSRLSTVSRLPGCCVIALLLCAGAVRAQPVDPRVRLSSEASQALVEKRYAAAARAFEQLRELSPDVGEVHANLGFVYFQQGRFKESVASLERALALKRDLPNLPLLLAMAGSELGRHKEALPDLENGFKATTDPALRRMAGLELQRAYTGLQRHADAVSVALTMTRLYPRDPEVLYQASRLHANLAFETLRALAAVAPGSVWVHLAAGEASEAQGLDDAALAEYRAVLAADPKRPGIHFRIGRVLLSRHAAPDAAPSEPEALKEFMLELEIDPTNANAAYEVAEMHRRAGDATRARAFFQRALDSYPDFEDALVGLGRTLVALEDPKAAIRPLTRAIALNPASDVAYYQLAQAYRALGDTTAQEKALATFRQLRSLPSAAAAPGSARPEVTKQTLDPDKPVR